MSDSIRDQFVNCASALCLDAEVLPGFPPVDTQRPRTGALNAIAFLCNHYPQANKHFAEMAIKLFKNPVVGEEYEKRLIVAIRGFRASYTDAPEIVPEPEAK
jgi:hypothetical protein